MLAESRDPATGQVWRTYPAAGPAEVERAVAQARAAQRAWGARPLRERVALATRFHRALYGRRHEVADVIARENGKPAAEAMAAEVVVALDLARYYASHAPAVLADRRVRMGNAAFWRKRLTIAHEPFGVIGIISPWNYPFMLAAGCALPALIAGNAVVLKPSEYTPTTGLLLGELLAAAGAPHGGVKGSGFGRSHGAEGLAECVRAKAIVVDRLAGVRQPWWFGYSAERARNTDAFVRFRHGARLAERVRAVPRVLRLLRRGDRAV
jgi:acyl-CoA reductase-like NAD-dependent aldehyde dehydrogenase